MTAFMDYVTGIMYLYNMAALCNMKKVLCNMRNAIYDMRSVLCDIKVCYEI